MTIYKFNPAMGIMLPVEKKDYLTFRQTLGGIMVVDDEHHGTFTIAANGDIIDKTGNLKYTGVNVYDARKAYEIAQKVTARYGQKHPYANFKKFCRGCNEGACATQARTPRMPDPTKEEMIFASHVMEELREKYSSEELLEMLYTDYEPDERLDEWFGRGGGDWFGNSAAANEDRNKRKRRFWRSIPSILLLSLISWPLALLMGIGALRDRFKSLFTRGWRNLTYGFDAMANPSDGDETDAYDKLGEKILGPEVSKEDIKQALEGHMTGYYAEMSNGEVFKVTATKPEIAVPAFHLILDALKKENVYAKYADLRKEGNPAFMGVFGNGERWLCVADNAERAKEFLNARHSSLQKMFNNVKDDKTLMFTIENASIKSIEPIEATENIVPDENEVTENMLKTMPPVSGPATGRKSSGNPRKYYNVDGYETWKVNFGSILRCIPSKQDPLKNPQRKPLIDTLAELAKRTYEHNKEAAAGQSRTSDGKPRAMASFRCTMTDGDVYVIAAYDEVAAREYASNLMAAKIKTYGKKAPDLAKLLASMDSPLILKCELLQGQGRLQAPQPKVPTSEK